MWRLALEALGPQRERLRVVDPAAGDGSIVRAVSRHTDADVTAVELDPALLGVLGETGARVVHADALTLSRGSAPSSEAGTRFGALAPAAVPAFLRGEEWADVVIANPPYLRETGNRSVFEPLRRWHGGALRGLYRKDADLHHFFWELAIRWLRPGGVLVFLTPAYFLEAEAAQPLREMLLAEGTVLGVWRPRVDKVFPDASVEAAVTVWQRGRSAGPARRLDEALTLDADLPVFVPSPEGPWWMGGAPELTELSQNRHTIGSLYRVVEGVSTGANRLRKKDVGLVPDGRVGEGVLVLSEAECAAFGQDAPLARRARGAGLADEWVLMIRDRSLTRLDTGVAPETALERHLVRFRRVLERRAEMRRNARRSWYAVAWPRPERDAVGAIVTPKWSLEPAFGALDPRTVPMTDYRILVPRAELTATCRASVLAWLQSAELRPWFEHRMKRKGRMIEFYGACLSQVPVPSEVLDG